MNVSENERGLIFDEWLHKKWLTFSVLVKNDGEIFSSFLKSGGDSNITIKDIVL